jgi:hypothetical protein
MVTEGRVHPGGRVKVDRPPASDQLLLKAA